MSITTADPPTQPQDAATIRVSSEAADIVSLYLRGEFDAFNAPEITEHAGELSRQISTSFSISATRRSSTRP